MEGPLYELLRRCTVRLSASGLQGTGFFVASDLILTCAHVVKKAGLGGLAEVYWNNQKIGDAQVLKVTDDSYPDLALLQANLADHSCVYLSEGFLPFDNLYSYGYPPGKYQNGDSAAAVCEGPTDDQQNLLIKFKGTQIQHGMSGSPLLNVRTGGVCGIIQLSRDPNDERGGRATPTQIILRELPELAAKQLEFHQRDKRWIENFTTEQRRQLDAMLLSALSTQQSTGAIEVFSLYADVEEDKKLLAQLETHFATMQRQGLITTWNKGKMEPGEDEKSAISEHLNRAKIILLMVSSNFMASHYRDSNEVEKALEKSKTGTRVIPVILRPTDWKTAPFGGLMPLPRDGKPITKWSDRDEAFLEVAQGIRKVAEGLKNANPR